MLCHHACYFSIIILVVVFMIVFLFRAAVLVLIKDKKVLGFCD